MAQYRIPHPYNAHFALPDNVMAEPPGRGTLTTQQRPRKSFEPRPPQMPAAWDPGFAIPSYIRHEHEGRGAMSTHQARRRTIPGYLPEELNGLGSLGNDMLGYGALGWNPIDTIKDVGGAIAGAAGAVGSAVKGASVKVYKGGKWVVYDLPKGVHCKIASSQIGTMGAGAIGKYYGVPPEVAMEVHKGVNMKVCGEKYYPAAAPAAPPQTSYAPPQYIAGAMESKWFLPAVGIGVVGVGAAIYFFTRK